ncbi:MAG: tyrosine--tRNA ligase [Parcubacteria group bacterium]|nr:tyrosine--tRNA ligase [Parcubacteria group bacterium]
MAKNFLDELSWRGLIYQKTPGIEKLFDRKTTLYFGIDPTAESMHIGNLLGALTLRRAQEFGHKVILLAGGGTVMIGDPSGKEKERPILTKEVIERNKAKLKAQLSSLFEFRGKNAIMLDNSDWLSKTSLITFLREAGKYISANSMLDLEAVKTHITRREGISLAEFTYQALQAFDFLMLYEKYGCEVQIGGSDQWGNIIQGVELIRKKSGKEAHGLSYPLVVDPKTGKKIGKSEGGGNIWLDPEKTHPFAFYQFLLNLEDDLAPQFLRYYSFKSRDEIESLEKSWEKDKSKRLIQKELAFELTSLIHGKKSADQVKKITEILFEKRKGKLSEKDLTFAKTALPQSKISSTKEFSLEKALVDTGLASSKNEARRLVSQKGASAELFFGKFYLIRKGKNDFALVEVVGKG